MRRFCEKLPEVPPLSHGAKASQLQDRPKAEPVRGLLEELRWGKSQTCAFAVGGRCEKSSADPKVVFSVPYPGEEGSDRVALESTQCHQGHPTHQALPRQHIWTLCLPSCPVSVGSGMTGDFRMLFSKGIGNAGK